MTPVHDIIKHQTSNVFKTVHLDREHVCPILGRTTCVMKKDLHRTFRACIQPVVGDRSEDWEHQIYQHVEMPRVLVVSSRDDLILWMKFDYPPRRV